MTARFLILLCVLLATACGQNSSPSTASSKGATQDGAPTRALSILVGREPASLALKPLGQAGSTIATTRRMFNAMLTLVDAAGDPHPYLATSLPELDTASWVVSPDGTMETTYPLRPNLVWHDGVPLTADDFVFSWRLYAIPELGQSNSQPTNSIDSITAPDPETVVIHWSRPYPLAGTLGSSANDLPLVPAHIMQSSFDQLQAGAITADTLIRQPYWTSEFIGLGPYKLESWEPGVGLNGVAFDDHVMGRPKINQVTVGFSTDQNATLARVLGGYADYVSDSAISSPQAVTLRREWAPNKGGSVFEKLDYFRGAYPQLRSDQANPLALTDVRVRQALAYGIDRQALQDGLEGLFEGGAIDAPVPFIPPTSNNYTQVDRLATKYPYDPQRSAQLMADAGLTKASDGFYQSPSEGHLRWEVKTSASVDNDTEISVLASSWKQLGFDFQQANLPAALAQDGQARATFPTIYSYGTSTGESMLIGMNTAGIPRPENRWSGSNRGGWSNSDFDQLSDTLRRTLDPATRTGLIAQMVGMVSKDAVIMPLYFYGNPVAVTASIKGPGPVVQETTFEWNIAEWEIVR